MRTLAQLPLIAHACTVQRSFRRYRSPGAWLDPIQVARIVTSSGSMARFAEMGLSHRTFKGMADVHRSQAPRVALPAAEGEQSVIDAVPVVGDLAPEPDGRLRLVPLRRF
jgi:hypothetical protein